MRHAPRGRVPRLHVVTDDAVLADPAFPSRARRLLVQGGAGLALHVRGPRTPGGTLLRLAAPLAAAAAEAGALLVVNDRVDVALASGAAGVHLGRRSLPVAEAKRLLPSGVLVGASVHGAGEAAQAQACGADWAFVGSVWATPSHPDVAGGGPALLRAAAEAAPRVPLLAIGGVTPARVGEALRAGAHGVAVIRGIWDAADLEAALGDYQDRLAARGGHPPEET
ncbi:MAG: thiamine-phosphate synthase [Gemmatimonadota bacterium]